MMETAPFSIKDLIQNPLKLKGYFLKLSLRQKHGVHMSLIVLSMAFLAIVALQGLYRVYSFSYPLARVHFPLASNLLSALHSLEVSRSIVIQYALEKEPGKLSFLKKSFETEFKNASKELQEISELGKVPKEIKSHLEAILKSQAVFSEGSELLFKAHDEQILLTSQRMDQIQEANRMVEQMVDRYGVLTARYPTSHDIQFLTIAAQVILLEQRYLYQAPLSSPLSLSVESGREEETHIIQNKEKLRSYVQKFFSNLGSLQKKVSAKDQKLLTEVQRLYRDFLERVQGEEGVFLISEDEIAKLSTVGLQLERLQMAYEDGSMHSKVIQKNIFVQMGLAGHAISSIKTSSLIFILVAVVLMIIMGLWFGKLIARYIIEPIEELTHFSKLIGEGKFGERAQVHSQDEVGELAEHFNSMAENLQKWNESLGHKVQQRTEALALANARLQKVSEMKSQFLSNVSHDLKTPLNAILGFTQVVLSDSKGKLTEQQTQNLNSVVKSGKELLQFINLILEFSRMEEGKLSVITEEFVFESLLDECLASTEVLLNHKPITLLKEIQTHLAKLNQDRPKVKRILLNLLSNAAKFTRQGTIKVSVKKENEFLVVVVEDTGLGISKDHLLTIFDDYKSKRDELEEGSGLGLSITKRLVTVLGGGIDIQSELGKGSIFTVKIPFNYRLKEKDLKEAA